MSSRRDIEVLKQTERSIVTAYDRLGRQNTLFAIANDAPGSDIACLLVEIGCDSGQNPRITVDAITRQDNPDLSRIRNTLGTFEQKVAWCLHLRRMTGLDLTPHSASYLMGNFAQADCRDRNQDTPYERLVDAMSRAGRIGPECRRDLLRILSIMNVATEAKGGHVAAAQLSLIGNPASQGRGGRA